MYHLYLYYPDDEKSLTWIEKPAHFMQNILLLLNVMIRAAISEVWTIYAQLHLVIFFQALK